MSKEKSQEELQKELDKSNHGQEKSQKEPGAFGFSDDTDISAKNEEMKKKGEPTLSPEQIKKLEEEKHKFQEPPKEK